MQIGMLGLGRMGQGMALRLIRKHHECVVFDIQATAVTALATQGANAADSLDNLVSQLARPRIVWLMLPAALVDQELTKLSALLDIGDIVVDGGNSYYRDDIGRSKTLKLRGIHYVDVGTSGGVFGLERGFCLMIGGEKSVVQHLAPIFAALAPGEDGVAATPGRAGAHPDSTGQAEQGYLHCGAHGAGHFVKMIHNGIEYGLMAAYAEGLNILRKANICVSSGGQPGSANAEKNAETTPMRNPEFYQYEFDLPEIVEVWRRGSVISSWLLDLTANALQEDPSLEKFAGRVSDSGEGRWTIMAAIDEAVPVPVLSAALYERFSSRNEANFSNKVLSAMRHQFGGHVEKPGGRQPE
ncbi:decarboxylating 6-phosphogluconate dehydrogenase [soil metagenome]